MDLYRLDTVMQHYDWGQPGAISAMAGRPVTADAPPEAELWMGTHPRGMSIAATAEGAVPLGELVARSPEEMLGARARSISARSGTEEGLPFLLKILAAERALSVQAHPSRAQAVAGFDREERAGTPRDARDRNYRDRNHKPELLMALTPFAAMCGFRPLDELAEEMRAVTASIVAAGARGVAAALETFWTRPTWELWRDIQPAILNPAASERETLAAGVAAYADVRTTTPDAPASHRDRYAWVGELMRQFPGDPGLLAPLVLNVLTLRPGEAVFLPEQTLHAYLHGVGVEIMANSDNVLRSGCTSKHVDAAELVDVVRFEALAPMRFAPGERYAPPAEEFELRLVARATTVRKSDGPAIVLALGGEVGVSTAATTVRLRPTESAFIPHATDAFAVAPSSNGARLAIAAIPGALDGDAGR